MTDTRRMVRPVDASMGLLHEVINRAVDPGYAEAAARPRLPSPPAARVGRGAARLLVALVLGAVTVTAVVSLRTPEPTVVSSRGLLEREITGRSADAEELARSNEALSAEIAQLQADALQDANPGLFAQLEDAELLSGAVAVSGPGLVIELDDGDVGGPDGDAARVQDVDLQIVANGLWAAGAEAMAINGQRLTALSAIRSAGQAILVDLAPLLPPYRVEAIGDAQDMQTAFARSTAANHLAFLSGTYAISVDVRAQSSLELAGAGTTVLRYASTVGEDGDAATSQEEGSP